MKISAGAVRRQVDQERCKQNFEFCIESRFRMQSYSSSASQIGYRACGKEKVINEMDSTAAASYQAETATD